MCRVNALAENAELGREGAQSPEPASHVCNGQEASLQLKQGLGQEGVEYSQL